MSNNFPARSYNHPDLAEYLNKLDQIYKDSRAEFKGFYSPREFFNHPKDIVSIDISNKEVNLDEKL